MICKISNFNKWTAKHFSKVFCTELTLLNFIFRFETRIGKIWKKIYCISANIFNPWIVTSFEQFPQQKFSLFGKKLKFAATFWIFYNFQIPKRIVSAEIRIFFFWKNEKLEFRWFTLNRPLYEFVCLFVSASIVPLVAMLSAPLSSPLCSSLGRRRTMMSMTIPMAAGWLIITFATDSSMILIGRALCSAVSSISVPAAYSYVAEIANSSNRGFLGSLLSCGWTFGLVISYTLGSVLDWNFLALSACTVPIAQLIVLWVLSMSLLNNFNHQIYLVRF